MGVNRGVWATVLLLCAAGCSGSDEVDAGACPDLGGDPSFTEFTVTPATVAAGDSVDVVIDGDHLGELEATSDGSMEMAGEEEESTCAGGHVHIYLDDLETNPLSMQEAKAFPMTIPADTEPGTHTLIVRLHNKDHTIYDPEVSMETTITVE
jgi:hypothetical protein